MPPSAYLRDTQSTQSATQGQIQNLIDQPAELQGALLEHFILFLPPGVVQEPEEVEGASLVPAVVQGGRGLFTRAS